MHLSPRSLVGVRDRISLLRSSATGRPAVAPIGKLAAAPLLTLLLACGADAWAEHECGPPEAGVEIVCSPSNYDPSRDGNIFYGPDEANEDITIRLSEGLAIHYDREAPGDDVYVPPDDPENPRYSAVWVTPWEFDYGYSGAISLTSLAEVTSNGRGISVGHYGESGPLRMEILGGSITTTGEGSHAIHSYREGAGDTDVIVRNVPVQTDGSRALAIVSTHWGEGALNIDVGETALSTRGAGADGVYVGHRGAGDLTLGLQDVDIATAGTNAYGIIAFHTDAGHLDFSAHELTIHTTGVLGRGVYGLHLGRGDVGIHLRSGTVSTTGASADGIAGDLAGQGNLHISVQDVAVATAGDEAEAVYAEHTGDGDMDVDVQRTNITTEGAQAEGILAQHKGMGALDIAVRDLDIDTAGHYAEGVFAAHTGLGGINVDAQDIAVVTTGEGSDAILGGHTSEGDLDIRIQGGSLSTGGAAARGIVGVHKGTGALHVDLRDLDITTAGESSDAVLGKHTSEGDLDIRIQGGSLSTGGAAARGIHAVHEGTGALHVDLRDLDITTAGESSDAVLGKHTSEGDLDIRVQGGSLSTGGAAARGIVGVHKGTGAFALDLRETAIATTGEHGDGVATEHEGSGPLRITVDASSVRASGPNAHGIRMGRLNHAGMVEHALDVDDAGYPDQSVTVNGPVLGGSGEGAGVFLAGGGRVVIGPRGTLGAASGLAVRTAGEAPKILVDMDLDRRRVAQVIGDHFIRNDEGETTILVNSVVLHAGASGATGLVAPNGAWNVTIVGTETVAGRVFSREDFREVYVPRAAVYEALPGLLLRLDARGLSDARIALPDSPAWVRLSGARESYKPDRASVGAEYTFGRIAAEAGLDLPVSEDAAAFVSARRLRGSADVTSPTGGGEIEIQGLGMAFGVAVRGPHAHYARGRVSLATYTSDLSSKTAGRLATGIDARVDSLDLEAGRHIALNEEVREWSPGR